MLSRRRGLVTRSFEFDSSFVLRHSSFVIRHFRRPVLLTAACGLPTFPMTALATDNNLIALPELLDLDTLNPVFERQDPTQVVEWAAAQFGGDLVMSSSFGAESAMLIHMA